MSIYPVTEDNIENFSILTTPKRSYSSSSTGGITGSIYVQSRRSHTIKNPEPSPLFINSAANDINVEALRVDTLAVMQNVVASAGAITSSVSAGAMANYLSGVHSVRISSLNESTLQISRWTPTEHIDKFFNRKSTIKNSLIPFYRGTYRAADWGYYGYNTFNFMHAKGVFHSGSALIYPLLGSWKRSTSGNVVSGSVALDGEFSIDFHVNMNHNICEAYDVLGLPTSQREWNAGTICHLSGCYALSVHSGSAKDASGNPVGFKLAIQFLSGTKSTPSSIVASSSVYPNLIFISDDNALQYDTWHRVVIRWGTSTNNFGTGSFNIDGVDKGTFLVPSSSLAPHQFAESPAAFIFGNFYEGSSTGTNSLSHFFSDCVSTREGVKRLTSGSAESPAKYYFRHPLKGEIHNFCIRRNYLTDSQIISTSGSIVSGSNGYDGIAFLIGPYYQPSSSYRSIVSGTQGGIPFTPFVYTSGITVDPYNVGLFGSTGGMYVNLENYCADIISGEIPRFHSMSVPVSPYSSTTYAGQTAQQILKSDKAVLKRNSLITACTDDSFLPDYNLIKDKRSIGRNVDDLGHQIDGYINLSNIYASSSFIVNITPGVDDLASTSMYDTLIGPNWSYPTASLGVGTLGAISTYTGISQSMQRYMIPTSLYNRTRDESSSAIVSFNVSSIYYGQRIRPGTFQLIDPGWIVYSNDSKESYIIRDDGHGGLYRVTSGDVGVTWASIGTIFYEEGVILLKDPLLYRFGENGFSMSFSGERGVYVMKIDAVAPGGELNVSRNPTYKKLKPSDYVNDPDDSFVYITGVNFHDDNLNIVLKAQFAQPIVKRQGDRFVIRTKIDW